MGQRRLLSYSPSPPSTIACPNSVDAITSIAASLDLNRTDSNYAAELSHSSSVAQTQIYKRVRWADGLIERIERAPEINDWIRRRYWERRATKRHGRPPTHLEAYLRSQKMAFTTQDYLNRKRVSQAGLLKGSRSELVYEESEDHRHTRLVKATDIRKSGTRRRSRIQARTDGTRGRSKIQPRTDCARRWNRFTARHLRRPGSDPRPAVSAVREALSQHARDGIPLQKPDHRSYNVDAFPSSGILNWYCSGSESQQQTSVSPWTAEAATYGKSWFWKNPKPGLFG